jgi:hypothetical protein
VWYLDGNVAHFDPATLLGAGDVVVAYYSGDATYASSSSNYSVAQQLAIGVWGNTGGLDISVIDTTTGLYIPDADVFVNTDRAPNTYWDGTYYYSIAYSPAVAVGSPFVITVTTARGQVATVTGTFIGMPQISTPVSGADFVASNPLTVSWTSAGESYTLQPNCYPTSCFTVVPVEVSAPATSYQYPANTFAVGGSVNFYVTARSALTYSGATVLPSAHPYLESNQATSFAYPVAPPVTVAATTTTIDFGANPTAGSGLTGMVDTWVRVHAPLGSGANLAGVVNLYSNGGLIGTSGLTLGCQDTTYETVCSSWVGSTFAAGTYTMTASFTPTAGLPYTGSSSSSYSLVVKPASTISVASSLNPSGVGASVTFTMSYISAGGASQPGGTVDFRDGYATLATAIPLSCAQFITGSNFYWACQASYTTTALAAGSHSIQAAYSGDATLGRGWATVIQTVQ